MDNKHAYLILAHNEFHMLKKLIHELDDERNDIYIHIDKKTRYVNEDEISSWAKRSGVFFVPRVKIYWGTESMVKAEIVLLKAAVKREYHYYHLLSGVDFPLKNQDAIHTFLEDKDCEYMSYHRNGEYDDAFMYKVKHYFPLLKIVGTGHFEGPGKKNAIMRKVLRWQWEIEHCQEAHGVDRTKKYKDIVFYKGDQWFSITHDFACYIISQKNRILKMFWMTNGPDEFILPTLAMNSQFSARVQNTSLRIIDWKRGCPYEYTEEDLNELTDSKAMFARKISYDHHPQLVRGLILNLHSEVTTNNKSLVSIIVPCYNVESYLARCVDSLIAQTYPNIEILLIDDGSTDATSDLARGYAERYDTVFYHHRINGGLSAARNTGIELAKGEYIAFVDSDDWVDENYINCLFETIQAGNADISVCGYIKEFDEDRSASEVISFDQDMVISSHSAMKMLGDIYPKENVLLVIAWNKLFKRSIFENTRFPEGKLHEDEFTTHRFIGAADSIAVTTANLYHYRIRGGSITSDEKKQDLRHLDYLDALQDRLEYSRSMMYGDLFIFMLYTYYEGMKQLMANYTDVTVSKCGLYRYFRKRAFRIYLKYFNELDGYQKKDYLKLIIFTKRYRNTVIRRRKES